MQARCSATVVLTVALSATPVTGGVLLAGIDYWALWVTYTAAAVLTPSFTIYIAMH